MNTGSVQRLSIVRRQAFWLTVHPTQCAFPS